MSYGNPSDDVAESFREALADLSMNSRYEISNLTVIAKENTEHALAISEALKSHIRQTSPPKKLLAFYVLDSIVKNVGTPYTLFFGRQLYTTFMEAYALVDNNVRRKMDEMLKTWKEPVPGSIDTRPVFPPEVTRPIENALIKARTSAVQAQQEHQRNQQQLLNRGRPTASPVPYRATPPPNSQQSPHAPPGYPSNYGVQQYPSQQYPSPVNGQQYDSQPNGPQVYGLPPRPPSQQYSPAPLTTPSWQPQNQVYGPPEDSVDILSSDVASLITIAKGEFARNPLDSSKQLKLKALLDLQNILQKQKLPPDQLSLIKEQVAELSKPSPATTNIQTPSAPLPLPTRAPAPTPVVAAQPPAQQPTLSSLLGPGALAALLARQSATPQPSDPIRSPQQPHPQPPYQPPPSTAPTPTPVPDPTSLLERLRAAGMLPTVSAASSTTSTPSTSLTGSLPPGFPPPPPFMNTPPSASRTPLADIPNDVVLKPNSLKIPRPHLISSLYERLGAPCNQCGRRFQSDEEGKKKKTAHMDWHFRVNHRATGAENRGQHRSWYVDEMDWINSREVPDELNPNPEDSANGPGTVSSFGGSQPKLQYLPVPDDPSLANSVCPICQEKFEMKWLDDAQEFVWMDARKVGDRIYHASCYSEATKDEGNSQIMRGTPEPVLGKRKAEDEHIALRSKIKTEAVS